MNNFFVILLMIFCHIVDDYYLQGILAKMKQKMWWKENAPDNIHYKYDYIWALIMHAFSWAFMIMLPIAYVMSFQISLLFGIIFGLNVILHAVIDNEKANKFRINLWVDQLLHIAQILGTAFIMLGTY
jgi:hypothetical protein